jgi:hypothetical protein
MEATKTFLNNEKLSHPGETQMKCIFQYQPIRTNKEEPFSGKAPTMGIGRK